MLNSVLPASQKAAYLPGDLLSFRCQAPMPGMGMMADTIRISGTLTVTDAAGARINNTDRVYWNAQIGVHGLINQISTSCEKHGVLESISDYGRAVATIRAAELGALQTTGDAHAALELCAPDNYSTRDIAFGEQAGAATIATPFAMKPMICLNGAAVLDKDGNASAACVPFDRTGDVEISIILSQASSFLHGADVAGKTYTLSNVQLVYWSAKAQSNVRIHMPKIECLYRTLPSTTASFQTKGTMVASRMLMSFIATADLQDPTFDSYRSVNAGVQRLSFTYGDASSLVTTTFRNQQEIMANYLLAMRESASFAAALATVVGLGSMTTSPVQGGYGVGIGFQPAGVDMRTSQLGLVLEGMTPVVGGYTGYLVFQGAFAL